MVPLFLSEVTKYTLDSCYSIIFWKLRTPKAAFLR